MSTRAPSHPRDLWGPITDRILTLREIVWHPTRLTPAGNLVIYRLNEIRSMRTYAKGGYVEVCDRNGEWRKMTILLVNMRNHPVDYRWALEVDGKFVQGFPSMKTATDFASDLVAIRQKEGTL